MIKKWQMKSLIFLMALTAVVNAQVIESDSLALVALYDSTDGANWTNTWDLNEPVNSWYGVTVNANRIQQLNLNNNNLNGVLPFKIGNLSALERLNMRGNKLQGSLPETMSALTALEWIEFDYNQLSGTFPAFLASCTSLSYLNLSQNQLSGSLPDEIGRFTTLTSLNLSGNDLSGVLPDSLCRLKKLEYLSVDDNGFSGRIPDSIGTMSALRNLNLRNNAFTGTLPQSLWNLTELTHLYLSKNNFEGELTEDIENLSKLSYAYLDRNNFSGSIPSGIGNLTSLRYLYLYSNAFSGDVPETFVNLTSASYIDLSRNQLDNLPDLSSLPSLSTLSVRFNRFDFNDLEPQTHSASLSSFSYSPQEKVGTAEVVHKKVGDTLRIEMHVGGTVTHYSWRKDGTDLGAPDDSVLLITGLKMEDAGIYTCMMTNDSLPGLQLESNPITVNMKDYMEIASDTVWVSGDTVFITADLYINPGVTLTIEPNVVVLFTGPYLFDVSGRILALGAEDNHIVFTSAEKDSTWRGIHFRADASASDSSVFDYCVFNSVSLTQEDSDNNLNGVLSFTGDNLVRISRSQFHDNVSYKAGAVFFEDLTNKAVLKENRFISNNAYSYGGVLYVYKAEVLAENNEYTSNTAFFGGAVYCAYGAVYESINNRYSGNTAERNGGACYLVQADVMFINNVVDSNIARYGAGLATSNTTIDITNNTFSHNRASFYGGAFYLTWYTKASVGNSIIWGNTADSSGSQVYFFGKDVEADFWYSDIQGDSSAFEGDTALVVYTDNINQDPQFVLSGENPYNLNEDSPCVNAGIADTSERGDYIEIDLLGNPRVRQGRIDMGAYETSFSTAIESENNRLPRQSRLYANYPNPFNPSTVIAYDVAKTGKVRLRVYNTLGQMVKELVNARQSAGHYKVDFNAAGLSSGVYFYQLKVGSLLQTRKMILLR